MTPNSPKNTNDVTRIYGSPETQEEWYIKIDGKVVGQATRAELEKFLSPPRLCSLLEVMCSKEPGVWHSLRRNDGIEDVFLRFQIKAKRIQYPNQELANSNELPPKPSAILRHWSSLVDRSSAFLELVRKYPLAFGAGFIVVLFNLLLHLVFNDSIEQDRQLITHFSHIWQGVDQFVSEDRPKTEWSDFATSSRNQLTPLLRELEKNASVHRPAQQHLLFGGRENLLEILKATAPPLKEDLLVKQFDLRLKLATNLVGHK